MPRLRIALCQINTTVGDLRGNVDMVIRAYRAADAAGADLAVFPEMTITGYPPEDLVLRPGFVADNQRALQAVASATGRCVAVVGFADGVAGVGFADRVAGVGFADRAPASTDVYNAAAICAGGRVVGVYHKRELPNYAVFDEIRTFRPGSEPLELFEIAGVAVGVTICEDIWISGGPVRQLGVGGAQLIVNINGSPYHQGKRLEREELLRRQVAEGGCPIVYLNLIGGQDELVFDGGSMIAGPDGSIIGRAAQFAEDLVVVDVEVADRVKDRAAFPITPVSVAHPTPIPCPVRAEAEPLEPTAELYEALVLATRDYVRKSGFGEVCLGLSGGIDSSLTAVIAAEALGPENVHGVLMPSRFSSDHSVTDAEKLAVALGIDHRSIAIEPAHAAFLDMFAPSFRGRATDLTEENLQSRIRGVVLMGLANKFGWLVLTTGNKSEAAVGYSTLYGDTAGAFAVIRDVYKLTVYELSHYANERAGAMVIDESVLTKAPSAELRPDQRDDQSLPPYDVLDPVLRGYVELDMTVAELIADGFDPDLVTRICRLVDVAEYKRRQTPVGPRVTTKGFGRDRRIPIVNRYRGWS